MSRAAAILLLMLLALTAPVSVGEGTNIFVEDDKDDFANLTGLSVTQSFLDIRNVTVSYDRPSDRIIVAVGFFAPLPSEGPIESSEKSSDYYFSCVFRTGENDSVDTATVILEKGWNWSSAYLRTQIRGYSFEGGASPVKHLINVDTMVFMIPGNIPTWGERPKKLSIKVEAGYESFKLSSGDLDAVYYDQAPQKDEQPVIFEVPSPPSSLIPFLVLALVLVPSSIVTWRVFRRQSGLSRRRGRTSHRWFCRSNSCNQVTI